MLDVVNRLADGFSAAAVIDSCHRGGLLQALAGSAQDIEALCTERGANSGNVGIAIRLLEGLGWVDRLTNHTVRLSERGAGLAGQIPPCLRPLLLELPALIAGDGHGLEPWLQRCARGWDMDPAHRMADVLDGALLTPVLVEACRRGGVPALDAGEDPFSPAATRALLDLLAARGWADHATPRPRLNAAGRFLVESGAKISTVASYWPMFQRMDDLLFGDAAPVFERDADGHERHLDRRMNILGSTAQHGSFFREMEDAIVTYFDSLPVEAQPTHIADLGCGDGTLLKRLHTAVATRTRRGAMLDAHPLTLIAADFNENSLDAARQGLAGLPHLTVQADIGNPAKFAADLAARGVDPAGVLHVRSFVDHDRPLLPPRDLAALERRRGFDDTGAHTDEAGCIIPIDTAIQSLAEHLDRWRGAAAGHGLFVLEVHCLPPATTRRLDHETEALHFDAYHAFARQHLVEASTFLLLAAEVGLLPQTRSALRFPRLAPYTRITLNRFVPRPYRIRLATVDDVPALLALEAAAAGPELRGTEAQVRLRLRNFPRGQLVAEREGQIVGAVYTQRIADPVLLGSVTFDTMETLHQDDGPVGQLLWLLAHPGRQTPADAEEWLDFALDYLAVIDGIERVAGVTRCRDYASRAEAGIDHDAYVALRDAQGLPLDPVLLMHASHGARIERVLPGFRPRDRENGGAGVLISYTFDGRHVPRAAEPEKPLAAGQALETVVREAVERVLGPARRSGFQSDRPLMAMGLESLDLLELRRSLGNALGVTLDPTFFFRHGTPDAIAAHFRAQAAPASAPVETTPTPAMSRPPSGTGYAIIGLACRMPGADTPDAFWNLVVRGGDGVAPISPARWRLFGQSGAPLDDLPREGALLSDIESFDAAFFGISPREAALLDPQQRLLLETVWHALEESGIAPPSLAGTPTGLFLGLMGHDYQTLILRSGVQELDGHFATGNSGSIAAGRISHFLDWHGPAVTIDTACSSSLVAVHQACRALQAGDCAMAVVGGVNLTLVADASLSYLRAGMLSPDGRCKTFDASANGYGRGEGVGVVVLKRLADAEWDGDRIMAVIRGSSVNQDGTGIGLTAPNETAQERLIGAALKDAALQSSDVVYLEAHGTGTSLGDPIEVGAASRAYGPGRASDRPLLLGSVKSSIGHLEAAAGIAGLIKVVLSLGAGELAGQAHFAVPNPHIAWSELPVEVVRTRRPWPSGRRIAGVSSFGFSGTNAHVLVEGYAGGAAPVRDLPAREAQVLALSAKSAAALAALVDGYAVWLGREDVSIADACFTAGTGRSHFAHRAAVVGGTRAALLAGLASLKSGSGLSGHRRTRARVGVLFTGQGSQWAGMAQGAYAAEPVFRTVVDRCCTAADALGLHAHPVRTVLLAAPGSALAALLDDTAYTQIGLYAVQCGLWALWRSWGLSAEAVLGHSVGEFAAAHAAGVLTLEDGARLVARRGALMGALPAGGAMAVVFAPADAVAHAVARFGLSLAAENGTHRVVSGPAAAVDALVADFTAAGTRCQRLVVSHAFHSALLDPMLDRLETAAAGIDHAAPQLPLISNLTGAVFAAGTRPDAAYWRRHARAPVQYAAGVATLAALDMDVLLELGPRPVLGPLALGCWPHAQPGAVAPPSLSALRPGLADERALAEAMAGLYAAGASIDFAGYAAGREGQRVSLPSYPFERVRHWLEAPKRAAAGVFAGGAAGAAGHPLLGVEHRSASGERSWTQGVSATDPGWVADHTVFGAVVAPGALHACLAAASLGLPVAVRTGQIHAPLVLEDAATEVQFLLAAADDAKSPRGWRVFARTADGPADAAWRLYASGQVQAGAAAPPQDTAQNTALQTEGLTALDVEAFYAGLAGLGIGYGPSFRGIERLWGGPGVAQGEIAAPDGVAGGALHPAVLDACLQVLMAALPPGWASGSAPYVPLGWDALELWSAAPARLVCEARLQPGVEGADTVVADLVLRDESGAVFGRLQGLMLKRASRAALLGAASGVDGLLYEVAWRAVAAPSSTAGFLPAPAVIAGSVRPRVAALVTETGFDPARHDRLQDLLARASVAQAAQALRALGWLPAPGDAVQADALRGTLGVVAAHARLFGRLLELLGEAGLLVADGTDGTGWRIPAHGFAVPDLATLESEAATSGLEDEIAWVLLARCGAALPAVLRGVVAPLGLLFPETGVGALALYRDAPIFRLMNALLRAAVERAVAALPAGRRLRVLEVGAGTGGTTSAVLPLLPRERTHYAYTDVSGGFFAAAERRFTAYPFLDYRVLDIERDPVAQGFAAGSYDLVVASNVLHATRDVAAAAAACRSLLAPGGALVLLEELGRQGWADLTFGLLEGWWRFTDAPLRTVHPLLDATRWRSALAAAGYAEVAVLHPAQNAADTHEATAEAGAAQGVIVARAPLAGGAASGPNRPGLWLLAGAPDAADTADARITALAAGLSARGQRVVLAGPGSDWRAVLAALPAEPALRGVVHLAGLSAGGPASTTAALAQDAERVVGSGLALAQALIGQETIGPQTGPSAGLWFVTQEAQIVAGEPGAGLAGAALWGMARSLCREHPDLLVRRLDVTAQTDVDTILDELLAPDGEDEAARRDDMRLVPRLVRAGDADRLVPPAGAEGGAWRLAKGPERTLAGLTLEPVSLPPPGPGEIQVAVAAAGLNFRDVLDALGLVPVDAGPLGGEFAGHVLATGPGVTGVAVGDRVVGLGGGCFGARVNTLAALVAPWPAGLSPAAAAGLPIVFTTAALAWELAGLRRGDRVLIHAGAGGVGLAAIRLAQAAGAEVFATASAGKRGWLRQRGVAHVHDSRSTGFAAEILAATDGRGVDVVLNSLTGEGFVAASLSALAADGRFIEIGKRGIWTAEEMRAARPDVAYHVLAVDRLQAETPERTGAALRAVLATLDTPGTPFEALPSVSYPVTAARAAMRHMQAARHIGKIVLTLPSTTTVRPGATYLITGGLGGIGLAVAGWLADGGATHLVLNGRRAPDAAAAAAVAALRARGVQVAVMLADMAVAAEVDRLLADIDGGNHADIDGALPPLAGLFHSVGLLRDGAVANQDWDRFAAVLGPKMLGGWQLHRATQDRSLDMFVLFSSTAGLLGNRGQANHAAANVFLDQLARHRQALGLPGLSIDWGAWAEIGEAAERRAVLEATMAAAGIAWMTPAQGLAALGRALAGPTAQLAVVAADWERVAQTSAAPLLTELLTTNRATRPTPALAAPTATAAITHRLSRTTPAQRRTKLLDWLAQTLQTVLRLPEPPDTTAGFSALGVDSLMSVELRNQINAELNLTPPLPATVMFDSPNLEALADTIELLLEPAEPEPAPPAPDQTPAPAVATDLPSGAVAIVGMACRFPQAPDLASFWRLLVDGLDAVGPIPPERQEIAPLTDPPLSAGLLENVDDFDPQHFGIPVREAPFIDPQQRLLLETAWHALEHTGIPASALSGTATGVFVGIGTADFAIKHANDPDALTTYSGAGSGGFAGANRISYALGLTGPSFAVNTACASSLTALHLAAMSLRAGECDYAIVGGVNLILHPSEFVSLTRAGVLSPTGRCRSFSADADGYVRGEGCGVVVLRRYADAAADGNRIAAVIRGTAISHVGASNGLSAPNGPAQEAVIRAAAARAGIDPAHIDYLEAQGTGTSLGDAIEMGAIRNAMTRGRDPARPLHVGTVKSNLGNLEEASGMASLIKTVLSMQHGLIPPTLHFRAMHPNIRLGTAPIQIAAQPTAWTRGPGDRRIAAVSGFGYGGANAHVVLEEGVTQDAKPDQATPPFVLALRSRTPGALQTIAQRYADALDYLPETAAEQFCIAANLGRSELGQRGAIVGADRETLVRRLRDVASGQAGPGIHGSEKPARRRHRIAFLFAGAGPQPDVLPMAPYTEEPAFRAVIDRCAAVYAQTEAGSLLDLMTGPAPDHAALYAWQTALVALWDAWGIRPDLVLGHEGGEVAAAACAGVIEVEDGMALVLERSRLLAPARAGAAETPAIGEATLDAFEAFAAGIPHGPATCSFVTGDGSPPPDAWPRYWRDHMRRPAQACGQRIDQAGAGIFVEIGPRPHLTVQSPVCVPHRTAAWLPSTQPGGQSARAGLTDAVATLYAAGAPIDWRAWHAGRPAAPIDVPLYPFERQRYRQEDLRTEAPGPATTLDASEQLTGFSGPK